MWVIPVIKSQFIVERNKMMDLLIFFYNIYFYLLLKIESLVNQNIGISTVLQLLSFQLNKFSHNLSVFARCSRLKSPCMNMVCFKNLSIRPFHFWRKHLIFVMFPHLYHKCPFLKKVIFTLWWSGKILVAALFHHLNAVENSLPWAKIEHKGREWGPFDSLPPESQMPMLWKLSGYLVRR